MPDNIQIDKEFSNLIPPLSAEERQQLEENIIEHGGVRDPLVVWENSGKLIFKCQDIVHNHKLHASHIRVVQIAEIEGFRLADTFILVAKNRMPSPQKGQQRHARIFHSYFLVLEKT